MSRCTNCKHSRIMYAPYIKERVVTCTKEGKCEFAYNCGGNVALKKMIVENHLSQTDVAKQVGISLNTLNGWLNSDLSRRRRVRIIRAINQLKEVNKGEKHGEKKDV